MADPTDPNATNWYTAASNAGQAVQPGQPGGAPYLSTSAGGNWTHVRNQAQDQIIQGGAANPYGETVNPRYDPQTAPGHTPTGQTAGGYNTRVISEGGATSRQVINPDTGTAYQTATGAPITFFGTGGVTQFGNPNLALLGGDPNNPGAGVGGQQSYSNLQNQKLQAMAGAVAGRTGPQANQNAVNMMAPGVQQGIDLANRSNLTGIQALQTADRSNLYAVQNALDTRGLATGQNVQGQQAAAQGLMDMSRMPAGPSVAEQQLKMGADRSMAQQMAMASGARGGNTGLALQTAAANQGQTMGDLNQQQALLRAQEDMANRQFASNQLQAAANVYGGANQSQMGAYGQAANIMGNVAGNQVAQAGQLGNIAGNQVAQGQLALGLTNTYADMAGKQLGADVATQGQNDQTALNLMNMGYGLQAGDRASAMQQQQAMEDLNARLYGINRGIGEQEAQRADEDKWKTIGAATGGISSLMSNVSNSDIRMKREIAPAGEEVSDAFRPLSASSYFYTNPQAPGSAPGRHYGPMAQELEQTPAGRSAVIVGPDGTRKVDAGRLALLNASETANLRRDLDEIKQSGYQTIAQSGFGRPRAHLSPAETRAAYQGIADANAQAGQIAGREHLSPASTRQAYAAIDRANAQADRIASSPQTMAPLGGVADTHLRPDLAPIVPKGAARPYAPGEYTENPDGSWSSERSMTVQNRDGTYSVIPSLYLKNGRPYEAQDEGEARRLAEGTKLPFRRFKDLDTAEKYSIDREAAWQPIENPADAAKIEPLWERRTERLASLNAQNARDSRTLAQIGAAQRTAQNALGQPTQYPAYGGYGPY